MRAIAVKLLTDPTVPPTADDLPGLGLTRTEAHDRFLDRYRRAAPEAPWFTIPDDGYLHDHLVWHLEQAGRVEDIHRLFEQEDEKGHNGWFRAGEDRGADAGYMADLFLAWDLADHAWRLPESADSAPSIVSRQCRYVLILSSLNSLAGNIPPMLLVQLVEIGTWPLDRALAYAYRIPEPFRRVHGLVKLLPAVHDASLKWDVTAAALAAAVRWTGPVAVDFRKDAEAGNPARPWPHTWTPTGSATPWRPRTASRTRVSSPRAGLPGAVRRRARTSRGPGGGRQLRL